MLIRDASDQDLPAIQAIYAHHVLAGLGTFEEVPPGVDELSARRAGVLARGLPWLVAELDGQLGGYAYANQFHARAAYRYTLEDSVYIAHDQARRGLGRGLLQALITRCQAGPWQQMIARIGDSGNVASIALHRALGFTPVGIERAVGFKLGRWVDVVIMQRALRAQA